MARPEKPSRYISIEDHDLEDQDLDSDSDTMAGSQQSDEFLTKLTTRMERKFPRALNKTTLTWVRWGSIVSLQIIMILVLLFKDSPKDGLSGLETGDDINGLFKTKSHVITNFKAEPEKFIPNMTSDANRMEIRANWDALMPRGGGNIRIDDYKNYPELGEPISDDPVRKGPLFQVTWAHSLHCLYYFVDSYHQMIVHGVTGKENPHHASHCFEYLRSNILCSADMTIEGDESALGPTGSGQTHICRNRDQALEWIEARRVDDIQSIVGG